MCQFNLLRRVAKVDKSFERKRGCRFCLFFADISFAQLIPNHTQLCLHPTLPSSPQTQPYCHSERGGSRIFGARLCNTQGDQLEQLWPIQLDRCTTNRRTMAEHSVVVAAEQRHFPVERPRHIADLQVVGVPRSAPERVEQL